MATSPDYSPVCSPDSLGPSGTSLDSLGPIPIGRGAADRPVLRRQGGRGRVAPDGRVVPMILVRAVRRFGEARPVDAVPRPSCGPGCSSCGPRSRPSRSPATSGPQGLRQLVRRRGARRGGWLPRAAPTEGAAPAHCPVLRSGAAEPPRPRRRAGAGAGARAARHRTPTVRARLAAGRRRPSRRDAPRHGQGRQGADRADRRERPAGATSPGACRPPPGAGAALSPRGIQLAIARLGRRAAVGTRCSPHTFRHTFARGYLVNGGDVFSLQQILGHATLDMVRRYVYFASFETVRRLHAAASPADGLIIGPKVSPFLARGPVCSRTSRKLHASWCSTSSGRAIGRLLATLVPEMELMVA